MEEVKKATYFWEMTPFEFTAVAAVLMLFLVISFVVFGVVILSTVSKIFDKNVELTERTTKVIEQNTKAMKDLDTTIKDRFLAYLEGEIGKNAQTK